MKIKFWPLRFTLPNRRSIVRRTEHGFWLAGFLLLAYCAFVWVEARLYQRERTRQFDHALGQLGARHQLGSSGRAPAAVDLEPLTGRLEIPRIGVSVMVMEGDDARTLQLGVGHLPGSARPGRPGNVVIFGHRDTFFRPLREIRRNDRIMLTGWDGTHQYLVEKTEVVNPENTSVLRASSQPTLTLITCYPFRYVGPAPRRFIVRATLADGAPAPESQTASVAPALVPVSAPAPVRARRKSVSRPPRPAPSTVLLAARAAADDSPPVVVADADPLAAVDEDSASAPESVAAVNAESAAPTTETKAKRGLARLNPGGAFKKLARVLRISRKKEEASRQEAGDGESIRAGRDPDRRPGN